MLKLRSILVNSKAAIDLASIMVGIIVIGLIGGVIAATVFAVIPWAQDNAAKQQLDSIHTAQNAAYGLSADPSKDLPLGRERNSFTNSQGLDDQGLLTQGETYCTTAVSKDDYRAYSKSGSGEIFFASNSNKKAVPLQIGVPGLNDCAGWVEENVGTGSDNPTNPGTPGGEETGNPTQPEPEVEQPVVYGNTSYTIRCDVAVPSFSLNLRGLVGTVTWSDGLVQQNPRALVAGQEYKVVVDGTFTGFTSVSDGPLTAAQQNALNCYRSMDSWASDSGVVDASRAFKNMYNLASVPESIPSTVQSTVRMFNSTTSINDPNISKWDVSRVTDMSQMFWNAKAFNQPVNNWNVGNVTKMSYMFSTTDAFNQPLNKWDVSKVTTMEAMFSSAKAFNQSLEGWNVKNVATTELMFYRSVFNSSMNGLQFDKNTNFASMFREAASFNQPLDGWNTNAGTTMANMFQSARAFNQNISNWDVAKVKTRTDFRTGSALTAENASVFK